MGNPLLEFNSDKRTEFNHATEAELALRVGEVYELLLSGGTRKNVLQYAHKQSWGISDRQVDDYIRWATAKIKEDAAKDRADALAEQVLGLRRMLMQSIAGKRDKDGELLSGPDPRLELDLRRELAKLHDLYPASRLDATFGGKPSILDLMRRAQQENDAQDAAPSPEGEEPKEGGDGADG